MCILAIVIIALSLCTGELFGDEESVNWAHRNEKMAWEKVADRFSGQPEFKQNRKGEVERIEVRGLKKDAQNKGWARVTFDIESGHVIEISSDRAGFTNAEFQLFQPFTQLEKLTLWHNSNFHDKDASLEDYDASGLKHLIGLKKLERITLAGGGFDDAGMLEAAKLKQLKYLGMWHVRVSDAGMSALRGHRGLEEIRLGPFWGKLMTNQTIDHLSTCPHLKKLSIGETWLTYQDGLDQLTRRESPLVELDLSNTLIDPGDVDRIRTELSGTIVKWEGLAAAGQVLSESGWHKGKASKWMPEDLLNSAMEAASRNSEK